MSLEMTSKETLAHPDPEVRVRSGGRRRFSAEYKLRILELAAACTKPGEAGALLRREGLLSSHLSAWRRQRDEGALNGLAAKKRGRRPTKDARDRKIEELETELARLRDRLDKAETIIEVQKKLSRLLGLPVEGDEKSGSSE